VSKTNADIVKNAAVTTDVVGGGILTHVQARKFIEQTFENRALGGVTRKVFKVARNGNIDKIGIAARVIRKKIENVDAKGDGSIPIIDPNTGQITGYRAKPNFSQVPYSTVAIRLPWEISEETLRENIEGEGLESTITRLMTTQYGLDLEDLCLNGDKDVPVTDPDGEFLYINDGWIKQISNGGHVFDASGMTNMLDVFYGALFKVPNKYNNGKLRWLMSPRRAQEWEQFLLNQALNAGGSYPERLYDAPASIPTHPVPSMPDDKIILADPENLCEVYTYDVKIRKTTEGKEAIMADKRFYVIHSDFDPIIEELDATCIIKNIGSTVAPLIEGSSVLAQIEAYAADNGIDLTSATGTTDMVAQIVAQMVAKTQGAQADKKPPVLIPEGEPNADWKVDQLRAYADEHNIDLTGVANVKVDIVAKIQEAQSR